MKVVEIKEAMPGDDRGPKIGCSIKLVSLLLSVHPLLRMKWGLRSFEA